MNGTGRRTAAAIAGGIIAVLIVGPMSTKAVAKSAYSPTVCGPSKLVSLPPDKGGQVRQVDSIASPSNFDPVNASAAELACYHFPPRPTDATSLANWMYAMSHATHFVSPAFALPSSATPVANQHMRSHAISATYNTYNNPPNDFAWSGYAAPRKWNGWTNLKWNEIIGYFNVPNGHTYCYSAQTTSWVGFGGDWRDGGNGNAIVQGGARTSNNVSHPTSDLWWEDQNYNGPVSISSLPVSPGDSVDTTITYSGNNYTDFWYEDFNTGSYTDWGNRYTPYVDQTSADFIVEGHPYPAFVNWGTNTFSYTSASGTWGSSDQYSLTKSLVDVSVSAFNSYNNSNQLVAYPGAIDSTGAFTDQATANATC